MAIIIMVWKRKCLGIFFTLIFQLIWHLVRIPNCGAIMSYNTPFHRNILWSSFNWYHKRYDMNWWRKFLPKPPTTTLLTLKTEFTFEFNFLKKIIVSNVIYDLIPNVERKSYRYIYWHNCNVCFVAWQHFCENGN